MAHADRLQRDADHGEPCSLQGTLTIVPGIFAGVCDG